MISDEELVSQFKKGDTSSFEVLFQKYKKRVFNTIYKYLGDFHKSEDLTQEVFLKVYKSLKKYKPKASFSTWLYRITVNICIDSYRKHKPITMDIEKLKNIKYTKDNNDPLIKDLIRHTLDQLHNKERIAVILAKYEGKSIEEIADIIGCSVSASKSLIHRAKGKLKNILEPYM